MANRKIHKKQAWHAMEPRELASLLDCSESRGLSMERASERLIHDGPNMLAARRATPWYAVFSRQFANVLIVILLLAAIVSYVVGELGDAVTILGIVFLNGILGFVQEWKAERALAALHRMLAPRCLVIRDGVETEIEARDLVRGDLVQLRIGDRVPADIRLVDSVNLQIDESALTGESESVRKNTTAVAEDSTLVERTSMAWMGTAITTGFARGIVVATGMNTKFGTIAGLTRDVDDLRTPLQIELSGLAKQLGVASIVISIGVALTGWAVGKAPIEMFLTGISLAVAVVPEGLPAVVTITLALGVRMMVRRRALLRRLSAAETLGAATVICTDKTGTLTKNEMTVTHLRLPSQLFTVTGVGYSPEGSFQKNGLPISDEELPQLQALLRSAMICNHARIGVDGEQWRAYGEPTEAALITAAYKADLLPEDIPAVTAEFSFSSERKRMTAVTGQPDNLVAHVKGAPEVILERCTELIDGEHVRPITEDVRQEMIEAYQSLTESGLRALAVARRSIDNGISITDDVDVEQALSLLGFVGIIDPARTEVPSAIATAGAAGIEVVMITGDAPETALAVARQIGLNVSRAVTGREIDKFSDEQLQQALTEKVVFARTTPQHKLRIVTLLQQQGHVVGMTGDGVNDAPALKKADIGISMGLRGTDVARNASDIVLTDDNFASIVGAVEEGRRQYSNITKFVRYLLSSNTGEVVAIFLNIVIGGPLILLPVQILWMNLVTDGMTAVALGMEPTDAALMRNKPRARGTPIVDRMGLLMVAVLGGYIGLVTLLLYHWYLGGDNPEQIMMAQTMAFTAIIVLEKVNVFNFRSLTQPLSRIGFFTNPWILIAWLATVGLQIAAVYVPFFQQALHTVPLGLKEWALIALFALPMFAVTEILKICRKRREENTNASIA
ncbi:MAG: cation-translocating P-type ATPase [Gammaproteobacteria bacterium]